MSKKKTELQLDDYRGAVCVMENYLEGAVADFENGDVENTYLIECCINTIDLIYALTEPFVFAFMHNEWRERFEKAKEKLV